MTTMEKSMEHICDAGLFLALGQFDHPLKLKPSKAPTTKLHHNLELEPSLTLGLSNDAYHSPTTTTKEISNLIRQSSCPHSITNSCLSSPHPSSVKREINDEEEEGSARKKLRLTKEQSAILEDKFKEHTTLTPIQKQALAKQLNLRPRQVEVWFQNRRARTKLKQTEVDCEILKRCCETLSEENKKLYKELEELKALKVVSQPVYMQLPHTTLTVCPSCERVVTPNKSQFMTNNPFQHSAAC